MTNEQIMADAQTLWDYHQLGHELRPTNIAIGLGSHDIGVAEHTADLYHRGLFPLIVFTGANAPPRQSMSSHAARPSTSHSAPSS
ncbi:Uncharacterised protein [Mycobacteroides abscessus subsp. abscessus]|nr:Uncharacterised protein [Mycobacteroides abscessus subsp. abscessus]